MCAGSPQDQQTMARAESLGCSRSGSDVPESKLSVTISADPVMFRNQL